MDQAAPLRARLQDNLVRLNVVLVGLDVSSDESLERVSTDLSAGSSFCAGVIVRPSG